ncbi:MAG: hypothetical protein Q9227_005666 [Pyrenula ochraceoflavens]
MDYFNFEAASSESRNEYSDFASDIVEANQEDHNEMVESLYFDKSFQLPSDERRRSVVSGPPKLVLAEPLRSAQPQAAQDDDIINWEEGNRQTGVYPLYRPKEPCDRCRQMGLECFLAHRGTFVNGCTICISLYRECSFTHKKPPGVYMDTLATLTEDAQEVVGGLTGRKTMRSLTGYNASKLDTSDRPRKAGARFGREATKVLKTWLAEHARHPYPTEDEKDMLKERTGLKRSQIANWLANARRRGKVPPISDDSESFPGAIDIPQPNPNQPDLSELNPFERWKISPPEHEAASATAIARAIQSNPPLQSPSMSKNSSQSNLFLPPSSARQSSTRRTSSNDDSTNFSMFQAPSVSSFGTARSSLSKPESASLSASAYSHHSMKTTSSLNSNHNSTRDRRRRRRGPSLGVSSSSSRAPPQKPRGARIFQCTFCTDSFPSKYDWQRHEKSLHLALERWTCAPHGGTIEIDTPITSPGNQKKQQQQQRTVVCVFCQHPNPTPSHLETAHSFLTCQDKTLPERTFYRKDHLRQHLRLLHNAPQLPAAVTDSWKSTTTEIKSRCGFCGETFGTWSARADHLAGEFRKGRDMKEWKGGWGLEGWVERLVENGMPPWLIGGEKESMDPFVAKSSAQRVQQQQQQQQEIVARRDGDSRGGQKPTNISNTTTTTAPTATATIYDNQPVSNCYSLVSQSLKQHIATSLSTSGQIPSDAELQRHARLTIYNEEDPWNQTCADNPLWLSILKRECGIDTAGEEGVEGVEVGIGEGQQQVVGHMAIDELPMMDDTPPPTYAAVRGGGSKRGRRSGSGGVSQQQHAAPVVISPTSPNPFAMPQPPTTTMQIPPTTAAAAAADWDAFPLPLPSSAPIPINDDPLSIPAPLMANPLDADISTAPNMVDDMMDFDFNLELDDVDMSQLGGPAQGQGLEAGLYAGDVDFDVDFSATLVGGSGSSSSSKGAVGTSMGEEQQQQQQQQQGGGGLAGWYGDA